MRGLYRYRTTEERWWACVEEDGGGRVNIVRDRYEQMSLMPPFDELPLERDNPKKTKQS